MSLRTIKPTSQFKSDLKREKSGKSTAKIKALTDLLEAILDALAQDDVLPGKLCDHALTGDWKGCRDLHDRPDLVLIYEKLELKPEKRGTPGERVLLLHRLGSHSELGL